ncbi:porin [Ferrimonas lipolytica]|uniref:Porin n=1 Tax=Ferrimonas lipolytica TaxID=2724191 RepID=A0A6H1UEQ5_9GAMM|nr:porin [Ferrimonas lipolytica]QIZ77575.1 porin [Ferrimonas lipolytica]
MPIVVGWSGRYRMPNRTHRVLQMIDGVLQMIGNMKKTTWAATAILAVLSGSATAAEKAPNLMEMPDFYGRIWLGVTASENGIASKEKVDGIALENYASRLGLKGDYQVNGDLTLFYQAEVGVDAFEEDDKNEPFNSRDTFLGVEGYYGSVLVGRKNTVVKSSEGPVDVFNATNADMGYLIAGQERLADQLVASSANYQGWTLHSTVLFEDDFGDDAELDGASNVALSAHFGDKKFKSSPLFTSVTWADGLNGLDVMRLVAAYKLGPWQLGALYQDTDSLVYPELGGSSYLASVKYKSGQHTVKAQFISDDAGLGKVVKNAVAENGDSRSDLTDSSSYNVSVGYDYQVTKALTVSAVASYHDGDYQTTATTVDFDDSLLTLHSRFVF